MSKKNIPLIYRKRRTRQFIIIPFSLFGFVLVLLINPITIILGFLIILICVIFSFQNWRCPNCSKYLGRGLSYKECPHCRTSFTLMEVNNEEE